MLTGDGESHTVSVRYRQPVIFRLSQAVSLLTLLFCIALAVRKKDACPDSSDVSEMLSVTWKNGMR